MQLMVIFQIYRITLEIIMDYQGQEKSNSLMSFLRHKNL